MKMKNKKGQPKFDHTKDPVTNKGDGLEEYISDDPNFKPGERNKKNKS